MRYVIVILFCTIVCRKLKNFKNFIFYIIFMKFYAYKSITSRCSTVPALRASTGQFLSRGFMVLLRKIIP
jgi:hypothetical protein